MAPKLLGLCWLFFSLLVVEAGLDGICYRSELSSEVKPVRKWKIVKGRRKTYIDYVPVEKKITECCEGYLESRISSNMEHHSELRCIPRCDPPCQNGDCTAPNICKCVVGYEFTNATCQPVCSEPCNNGTCVEPETCKCFPGFKMTDINVCTPICSEGCSNGTCVSPEVCHCNDGFTMTNGTCAPKCWPPCETGECIAPDTCSCGPGYESIMSNVTSCEPVCLPECKNGVCVGPNICMCDKGYEWHNGTCQPICSSPCVNGTCIASESCECYDGYKKLFDHVCIPECSKCEYGTCLSPENCVCNPGFAMTKGTCEPICTPPCINGVCTIPYHCECNPGYEAENGICKPERNGPYQKQTMAIDEHEEGTVSTEPYDRTLWLDAFTADPNLRSEERVQSRVVAWMYYVIPVLVLFIVIVIAFFIWKRHYILESCKGRSYIVSGDKKNIANRNNVPDVTFTAIQERQEKQDGAHIEGK